MIPRTLDEILTALSGRVRSLERRMTSVSAGGSAPPVPTLKTPYTYRYQATAQTFQNATWTDVLLDGVWNNQGVPYANGVFTVPTTGIWSITAAAGYPTLATATGRRVSRLIWSGSATPLAQYDANATTQDRPLNNPLSWTGLLHAGDTVELQYYQAQGSAIGPTTATPHYLYLAMALVAGAEYGGGSYTLPPRLDVGGAQVTDWNTAISTGWYYGASAANQPVNGTADTWWVGQVDAHLTAGGNVFIRQELSRPNRADQTRWVRFSADGGGTWSAWATALALTTQNLNTLTWAGQFVQVISSGATLALNYPITRAGYLEVIGNDAAAGVGVLQRYTDYNFPDRVYTRSKYNGTWSAWMQQGYDPGQWVTIPLASGFVAQSVNEVPAYQIIGRETIFKGLVKPSSGTFAVSANVVLANNGAIPTPALFDQTLYGGNVAAFGWAQSAAASGQVRLGIGGNLVFLTSATAASYVGLNGIRYFNAQ